MYIYIYEAQTAAASMQLKIQEKHITPNVHLLVNVWIRFFYGFRSTYSMFLEYELILSVNLQFHIIDPDVLKF